MAAVNWAEVPATTLAGPRAVIVKWLVTKMAASALLEGSATLVARIETLAGDGSTPGAVNVPSAPSVPHAPPPQPGPVSDHVTVPDGWPALAIAAAKDCTAPSSTLAAAGVTCTRTSLVTLTAALALLDEFAWLVASTWMALGVGITAGAWYMPLALITPIEEFPPGTPFTAQATAASDEPVTVAANPTESPRRTAAEPGVTTTETPGFDGGDGVGGLLALPAPAPHPAVQAESVMARITFIRKAPQSALEARAERAENGRKFPLWEESVSLRNSPALLSALNSFSSPRSMVDTPSVVHNHCRMPAPVPPRRVKSYSSATGYTYQYVFHEVRKARRGLTGGNEYIYLISADRKTSFPLAIFIGRDAVRGWSRTAGRDLNGTEEYAAAKMKLFQVLDEVENLAEARSDFQVDETQLGRLLGQLDL